MFVATPVQGRRVGFIKFETSRKCHFVTPRPHRPRPKRREEKRRRETVTEGKWGERERDRETERQRDRETERHRDRETERERE